MEEIGRVTPTPGALLLELTLIPAWKSNHMPSKVWDEITYSCLHLNGCIIGVGEWISNFIPNIIIGASTYPCWDKLNHVSKRVPRWWDVLCGPVSVATATKQVCGRSVPLELESQSGFISSAVADESGFGTIMCPWQLRADKGQHFRLSIFNFHHTVTATTAAISQKGKFCEPYISVRDNKEVLNISACFGESREREVYVSDTNVIQIGIIPTRRQAQQPRRFLVKYEGECFTCWLVSLGPGPLFTNRTTSCPKYLDATRYG